MHGSFVTQAGSVKSSEGRLISYGGGVSGNELKKIILTADHLVTSLSSLDFATHHEPGHD